MPEPIDRKLALWGAVDDVREAQRRLRTAAYRLDRTGDAGDKEHAADLTSTADGLTIDLNDLRAQLQAMESGESGGSDA